MGNYDIQDVLDIVTSYSPNGVGITGVMDSIEDMSYQSARRYLSILIERGKVRTIENWADSKTKLYVIGAAPVTITVPHWNPDTPNILAKLVAESLVYSSLNEQINVKQSRRFGLYFARLINYAAIWSDNSMGVSHEDVSDLRQQMELARLRAMWQVKVYNTLLDNKVLWNPKTAPGIWFKTGDVEFSPTEARNLYEQALLQHGEDS